MPDNGNLWNYNLNYFEWLSQEQPHLSHQEATKVIDHWIISNPPGSSRAWDPYPVSLRIINWIRFSLEEGSIESVNQSLAYQARWLSSRIEIHLLGNHYLVNGVALLFAGHYFDGPEADSWLEAGWSIVSKELRLEVLEDGGHFERSPMYHSLILEDVLNLLNLSKTYPDRSPVGLKPLCEHKASMMLRWLQKMTYYDGSFPLFNDAANGIASSRSDLEAYAERLSICSIPEWESERGIHNLKDSGFARIENEDAIIFAEIGGPGPSFQPGHAHAGTLGFELMVGGCKILVDTGTNTYNACPERDHLRSTSAHNTLTVDGKSSSEVWSSFRVGRRAIGKCVSYEEDSTSPVQALTAEHDGYRILGQGGLHLREWALSDGCLELSDAISDLGEGSMVEIRFHFAPAINISRRGDSWSANCAQLQIEIAECIGFDYSLETYEYRPEFGAAVPAQCLVACMIATEVNVTHRLNW
ncbi:MAG: alginate lyase family protein [Lentimonas sp.]